MAILSEVTSLEDLIYYSEFLPRTNNIIISFQTYHLILELTLKDDTTLTLQLAIGAASKSFDIRVSNSIYHPFTKINKSIIVKDPDVADCYFIKLKSDHKLDNYNSRSDNHLMSIGSHYTWNTKFLKSLGEYHFDCSNCQSRLFGNIHEFVELPSELWAEFMDFWHCHKPDTSPGTEYQDRYSAIKVPVNTIAVGIYYFSINKKSDCLNAVTIDIDDVDFDRQINWVRCKHCKNKLGELDFRSNLVKLNKWNLQLKQEMPSLEQTESDGIQQVIENVKSLDLKNNAGPEAFYPYYYAYSLIIDTINSSAIRMFLLTNMDDSDDHLFLWIINVGLAATTSELKVMKDCMKVYFSTDEAQLKDKLVSNLDQEELELPAEVMKNLVEILTDINQKLPENSKKLKNWNMGFLPFQWVN